MNNTAAKITATLPTSETKATVTLGQWHCPPPPPSAVIVTGTGEGKPTTRNNSNKKQQQKGKT